MRIWLVDSIVTGAAVLALAWGLAPPAAAQTAGAAYKVPRTADGLPDLQGIWQVRRYDGRL